MRRGYTREAYLELVEHIRDVLPEVSLTSDFICGFCDETEEEFEDTLSLIQTVKYTKTFMFSYSMREVCSFLCTVIFKIMYNNNNSQFLIRKPQLIDATKTVFLRKLKLKD